MLSGRGKTLLLCVVVSVYRALYLKASEQFVSGGHFFLTLDCYDSWTDCRLVAMIFSADLIICCSLVSEPNQTGIEAQ